MFDLDLDAIHAAMYALSASAEGDCYWCVPPDPDIEAVALGASLSVLPSTTPVAALHTFTLDSSASRCFFCDTTTLTPPSAPVPVRLADPSGGPVPARSSTVLPFPAVPSGSLSGLHLPSFSTNLTLLWHHLLGHPSLPHIFGMHFRLHVFGLPRSLPPLPPLPSLPCLSCVEGRQRAAPHSSLCPPMTAPMQTLHMDVWGLARVSGEGRERNFLLVVDDFTRYTTVFPLRSKGQVVNVLIPWFRTVRLQLRERFCTDLPVLCLHSDRGGEFSSNLLREFCRGEGILQSFTLLESPQQNGIAERCHGGRSHLYDPCGCSPFSVAVCGPVRCASAQPLALVSFPKTLPALRWTGKVGDASVFRVWGSCAFVRDTSADKLSARAIPCIFLCFSPDAPGWHFYHPTLRRVLPSQDVTFDELVPFFHLFPYRSAPPPPPPLFLAPVVGLGAAPDASSGVAASRVAELEGAESEGAGSRGAEPEGAESKGAGYGVAEPGGAEPGGVGPGGAEPAGVEPGGAELEGVESGGTTSEGAECGGAEPRGIASSGGLAGAPPR
ncbi:unnamed protein product, partial [Closterium sp. NIES-53]